MPDPPRNAEWALIPPAEARLLLPPALRRWWRGQPRLALEDSPAAQLAHLTALAPVERLLVLGPDAPALAALIADSADLQPVPLAVLPDARPPADAPGVHILRAQPHRLPLADAQVDVAVVPHQLRRWDDAAALRVLQELWRVLDHNGVAVLWEVAPSRSAAVNAVWAALLSGNSGNGRPPRLRTFGQLGQLAYDAGFAWVQTLPLRPFLLPPGPRLTVLLRKEHYQPQHLARA